MTETSTHLAAGPIESAPSDVVRRAQRVVADLFGPPVERRFAVRYWDGTVEEAGSEPDFTVVVRHAGALRRMLWPPSELSIVEAYLRDDVDVEGNLEAAATVGDVVARRLASVRAVVTLMCDLRVLPTLADTGDRDGVRRARRLIRFAREHSVNRDRAAVRFHYDVGNEFYALWLDRQMVYSCAYFERGDETLDDAQTAKLDLVCRKLRLVPGERLLDIGCGWGALVLHAARHYRVSALGLTLSERQASFARERIAAAGLSDRVRVEVRDYRDLGNEVLADKIASVGMVEHVGLARLPDYFAAAFRVLSPGGLFLNHGIVSIEDARPRAALDPVLRRLWKRDAFIRRYVFPDGDLVPTAAVIASAERAGFELRDVESLREHYAATLRHWVSRLETHEREAVALTSKSTYRVWRLYMSAAAHGFRIGRIGVIQSLLAKRDGHGEVALPLTRGNLYDRSS